jgi:ABC-2 type transport system permease protein
MSPSPPVAASSLRAVDLSAARPRHDESAVAFHFLRQLGALYRRELAAFFYAPMSYLVWAVFLVASGYLFATSMRDGAAASMDSSFVTMGLLLVFVTPLLTMRLIAEEAKQGTLEILLTDPVSEATIVTAKYLASVTFLVAMLAPTAAYPVVLFTLGQPDPGPVLAGYLGLCAIGCLFLAVGLFTSALTANQIAAAALAFTILLLFWVLGRAADGMAPGALRDVFDYLSVYGRFSAFRRGLIDTRSLIYCESFILWFLFCATRALGLRRLG